MGGTKKSNRWMTPDERIAANSHMDGECRIWDGARVGGTNNGGPGARGGKYGTFWFEGKRWLLHRWVYENHVGPIPEELTIDHLCGNHLCSTVAHLEAVTRSENTRRYYRQLDTCKWGHPYTPGSYYTYTYGRYQHRYCKQCMRDRKKNH